MLSKEEELRVLAAIDIIEHNLGTFDGGLGSKAQLWLAKKCKELNDELKDKEILLGEMFRKARYKNKRNDD